LRKETNNLDWTEKAACKSENSQMFYCDSTDNKINANRESYAKAVCRKCEVAAECLMFAISNNEVFGIWGSFAPKERNTLKNIFPENGIDIALCKMVVNKEIKTIKANVIKSEFGI
jgi:WhiB family redox-sensing transcriptional regulator